jgi:hypothetical protein
MPDDDQSTRTSAPFLDLSLPQLVAGAVAAATAALLSSQIGLLGTVLGAAFASIVSAVVTSGLVGGWHRVRTVPSRFPANLRGMVVTAAALALVGFAFHTGLDLVTRDLPRDAFASRWLAEIGLSRG